jgi:hypothetical protein
MGRGHPRAVGGRTLPDGALVAARSLKVFALPLRAIAVGWGRQGTFWLLHLCAARGGHSQPSSSLGFMPGGEMLVPRQATLAVRVLAPVAPAVRALGGRPGDVAALVVAQRHGEPGRCGCSDLVQGAACPKGSKVCSSQKDHVSAPGGPAIQRHGRVP